MEQLYQSQYLYVNALTKKLCKVSGNATTVIPKLYVNSCNDLYISVLNFQSVFAEPTGNYTFFIALGRIGNLRVIYNSNPLPEFFSSSSDSDSESTSSESSAYIAGALRFHCLPREFSTAPEKVELWCDNGTTQYIVAQFDINYIGTIYQNEDYSSNSSSSSTSSSSSSLNDCLEVVGNLTVETWMNNQHFNYVPAGYWTMTGSPYGYNVNLSWYEVGGYWLISDGHGNIDFTKVGILADGPLGDYQDYRSADIATIKYCESSSSSTYIRSSSSSSSSVEYLCTQPYCVGVTGFYDWNLNITNHNSDNGTLYGITESAGRYSRIALYSDAGLTHRVAQTTYGEVAYEDYQKGFEPLSGSGLTGTVWISVLNTPPEGISFTLDCYESSSSSSSSTVIRSSSSSSSSSSSVIYLCTNPTYAGDAFEWFDNMSIGDYMFRNWTLNGLSNHNSNNGIIYLYFSADSPYQSVVGYKDSARTQQVFSGQITAMAGWQDNWVQFNLNESNSSGLSGTVEKRCRFATIGSDFTTSTLTCV
jgi:hypothetical protein